MLYIYKNEHEIIPYNGEILKRFVGNKLVKTIANPTDKHLKEFEYMELLKEEATPEFDAETEIVEVTYSLEEDYIQEHLAVKKIEVLSEETPEE